MTIKNNHAIAKAAQREQIPADPMRRTALIAGMLYLLTFVSIPSLLLYRQVKSANYMVGTGPDTAAIIGGMLEVIVALAGIGTAIALYPVLKKQNESLALGLVASRVLEAGTMFSGVAFLSTLIAMRQEGVDAAGLAAHTLVTLYDRIFLLGQSFFPALNDLMLGLLLYRSGLAPRALSMLGIFGSAPLIAAYIAVLFGMTAQHGPLAGLSALPVALFEFSLGIYLVAHGFKKKGHHQQCSKKKYLFNNSIFKGARMFLK